MRTEKKSRIKICIALFVGYLFLALLFPYTGDDWAWGSSIGIDRLKIFFADYNGRYAGNLAVLALSRSKFWDAVVMAVSFLLVCLLSCEYTADRSKDSILLAAVLFFLMPKDIWAQVVVWTSGFTNYFLSALITVYYLVSIREITETELSNRKDTLGYSVWMFFLGFVGALFVESITVFNICLAAAGICYMFLKFRKYRRAHISFLLGSVIAAAVMFSNGAYGRIAQGEDYYRYVPVGFRDTIYFACQQAVEILNYILYNNLLLFHIITVLLLFLAMWRIKTGSRKKTAIVPVAFHICTLLLLCGKDAIVAMVTGRFTLEEWAIGFVPITIALLYCLSAVTMILCFVEKGRRFRMLLPLYCAVVSLVPLLVVFPIGPRCVFTGYFLIIVFTVDLFGYLRRWMLPEKKWQGRVLGLIAAAQLLFYLHIFYPVHYYDLLRLDYVKQQAAEGKKEVLMCDLPNSDYLWNSAPDRSNLPYRYKLFYGLDEELQFEFIPYQELEMLAKKHPD